ncbi:MAG TPA: TIGR03960 family B12-binding radical SAM protein [Dissulfurispiraceae bacterium]|nr:TIGR03960 family B12-binding radical SAM protein [Dissulfurispiraceae bacterium]
MNFALFQKPSRYFNAEHNACYKPQMPAAHVHMALAFPDVYEVGMSHLGLRILYDIINALPFAAAERVFAPWPDLEEYLRRQSLSLASLETQRPLKEFDIVGFSLQYELSYTCVLNMLDLAGIPVLAEARAAESGHEPLVIAGGPCTVNPAPMDRFIDAFLIGEAEEAVVEVLASAHMWKQSGDRSRDALLRALAAIPGVYVPRLHSGESRIERRIVADLDAAPFPIKPVLPYMQIVHDRIVIEISRGCTRGCRYCQAGMMYRPLRERSPETILRIAKQSILSTGYSEVSLSSLSAGDYSQLLPLVRSLNQCFAGTGTALALPSLRVGAVNRDVLREIRSVRKTGFTMAPEAATLRLRTVINKDFTDEAYEVALLALFGEGWQTLKLYFMIGLPTEEDADIQAIGEMAMRALRVARKHTGRFVNIGITVSPFVPKPHTPFQWMGQESLEELRRKLSFLRSDLGGRRFKYKGHDPETSLLEAVFSRGDSKLGGLIEKAWRLGCRLDGWSEHFDFRKWLDAMDATGIDGHSYAQRRFEIDAALPWDVVNIGVTKKYLAAELDRALQGSITQDCKVNCTGCGLRCAEQVLQPAVLLTAADVPADVRLTGAQKSAGSRLRMRVRFSKSGRLRYLSHLELMNALLRALRRADVPVVISEGFHPKPELSFGPPLGVGVAGEREFFDMEVTAPFDVESYTNALNATLPDGLLIGQMAIVSRQNGSLGSFIKRYQYRVPCPSALRPEIADALSSKAAILIERDGKEIDLSRCIESVEAYEGVFWLMLLEGAGFSVRIGEVVETLFGMPLRELEVARTAVYGWRDEWVEPL